MFRKQTKLVLEFHSVVYGTRTETIIFGTFLCGFLVCLTSLPKPNRNLKFSEKPNRNPTRPWVEDTEK
jgi:hypothetical protein